MKTGIIGGTFNPIHNGHIYIARELATKLKLDRVIFIPAALPPHKDDTALVAYAHRFEMVRRAIQPWSDFEISDVEHPQRGTSYSVDTLKILHQRYPRDNFYFLMGMDSFNSLSTWHQYQQLFTLAHLVVACRPPTTNQINQPPAKIAPQLPVAIRHQFCYDSELNQYCHSSGQRLIFLEDTCMAISSTQIRAKLEAHQPADALIPAPVAKYIHAHHLYVRPERS
jgi:nicotinate-nucleotide adenylyltransferase